MKITSIIFDWDGTIAKTLHLWLAGYRLELEKLGYSFTDDVIVRDFFYEHDKAVLKYPDINFDNYVKAVHDYVVSHVPTLELYPNTLSSLEKLQVHGVTLTLVSSSPRKLLIEGLKQTGLEKFFNVIVSGDDVMRHKPDPEPFEQVIEIAKLSKAQTIIIGDSHNDIIASKAAGVASALFTPKENQLFYDFEKLKQENPTYCFEDMSHFVDMIVGGEAKEI